MRRLAPLTTILLAAAAVGCGDQLPPDYQGETLAQLRGVLVNEYVEPLPEADIVLAWPDWSKGEQLEPGISFTAASTFARLPVDSMLPARFTATLVEPPPETAYSPRVPDDVRPRLVGPRYTSASILLARKGMDVKTGATLPLETAIRSPNEAVLFSFDNYGLTYVESDGAFSAILEDGSMVGSEPVKKGFHLFRLDRTECFLGYDQACIDRGIAIGFDPEFAKQGCEMTQSETKTVEVPLDTEIRLTVKATLVEPTLPPPCETPPAG